MLSASVLDSRVLPHLVLVYAKGVTSRVLNLGDTGNYYAVFATSRLISLYKESYSFLNEAPVKMARLVIRQLTWHAWERLIEEKASVKSPGNFARDLLRPGQGS
jgi:hypothetical protein